MKLNRLEILNKLIRNDHIIESDTVHYVLIGPEGIEIHRTLLLSNMMRFCYKYKYLSSDGLNFFKQVSDSVHNKG